MSAANTTLDHSLAGMAAPGQLQYVQVVPADGATPALLVGTVFRRNAHEFHAHWAARGRVWMETP